MTIAKMVRKHLRNKPYLLEALEKGIVNLSELSRQVQKELETKNTSAVKAALRRFAEDLQKHKQKREEKVLEVLKKSVLVVYDRKSVIIKSKEIYKRRRWHRVKNGMKVDLPDKFVYLLDKKDLPERVSVLVKHDNCTMIVIHSPKELEATPGVVAFLTTLLSEQKVNVIEFISCWTETIIVVEKKDSLKAYEVLSNMVC